MDRELSEDLRKWFNPSHPEGGWKRINTKGEVVGPCAREPGEPKPKCMSNEKRAKLSKGERASAVRTKRKHDPNPERKGKPIMVSNFGKGKISEEYVIDPQDDLIESMEMLLEKNKPTSPDKWQGCVSQARAKFDVYPSAYANGWAAQCYKRKGGKWESVSEQRLSFFSFVDKDEILFEINEVMESADKDSMPCNKPRSSTSAGKKKMVKACEGGQEKIVHYGAKGYGHNYSPAARKSFRARHSCDEKKSKLGAQYWACKDLWAGKGGSTQSCPEGRKCKY